MIFGATYIVLWFHNEHLKARFTKVYVLLERSVTFAYLERM